MQIQGVSVKLESIIFIEPKENTQPAVGEKEDGWQSRGLLATSTTLQN